MKPGLKKTEVPGLAAYLEARDVLERAASIARAYNCTVADIRTMDRRHPMKFARFDFWMYLHVELGWSYPTIGDAYRCDHTSVMNGVRRAQKRQGSRWARAAWFPIPDLVVGQSSGDPRR